MNMTNRIVEHLRELAIKCSQLAKACPDKPTANELEGIGADLAENAQSLDDLFNLMDKTSEVHL
jgi:hypothetical protein